MGQCMGVPSISITGALFGLQSLAETSLHGVLLGTCKYWHQYLLTRSLLLAMVEAENT